MIKVFNVPLPDDAIFRVVWRDDLMGGGREKGVAQMCNLRTLWCSTVPKPLPTES